MTLDDALLSAFCPACGTAMEPEGSPPTLFDVVILCPRCGYFEGALGSLIIRSGTPQNHRAS